MAVADALSGVLTLGCDGYHRIGRDVLSGAAAGPAREREHTWTVLGSDHCPVVPVEDYLEYLRAQQVSPNTVKSYARALALWWQFLELYALAWDAVTLSSPTKPKPHERLREQSQMPLDE